MFKIFYKIVKAVSSQFFLNTDSPHRSLFIKFITEICHNYDIKVCVEGVERKEELELLVNNFFDSEPQYIYTSLCVGESAIYNGVEYFNPSGNSVATSTEVWEAVVIPEMLANYTEKKRNQLPVQWTHSWVAGFDYYKYTKTSWLHAWGNIMPLHYSDEDSEFSYYNFNGGQWMDYSGGIIYGHWFNKNLGLFVEGTYNKYWNRTWHGFSAGINYRVF